MIDWQDINMHIEPKVIEDVDYVLRMTDIEPTTVTIEQDGSSVDLYWDNPEKLFFMTFFGDKRFCAGIVPWDDNFKTQYYSIDDAREVFNIPIVSEIMKTAENPWIPK